MLPSRHTRARAHMPTTITLRSSDGETFEVEEDVALCVPRRRPRDATRRE